MQENSHENMIYSWYKTDMQMHIVSENIHNYLWKGIRIGPDGAPRCTSIETDDHVAIWNVNNPN